MAAIIWGVGTDDVMFRAGGVWECSGMAEDVCQQRVGCDVHHKTRVHHSACVHRSACTHKAAH
eukprot:9232067-Pyramimonas_sp.AAC.1